MMPCTLTITEKLTCQAMIAEGLIEIISGSEAL
jgi:F0F1-type ATP synthase gamma subunit